MVVKRRVGLMLATAAVFAAGSASAQTAQQSDLDKVEQMQRQIQQLQDQMKQLQLKSERTEGKKKATEVKGTASPFDGAYAADVPAAAKAAAAPPSAIVLMSKTNAPSICTPDQLNCIGLTGRLHLDVGGYNYRPNTGLGLGASTSLTPGVPIQPATTPQSLDDGYNIRRAGLVAGWRHLRDRKCVAEL
jgi:phosphate-selective porin OprO and OprP